MIIQFKMHILAEALIIFAAINCSVEHKMDKEFRGEDIKEDSGSPTRSDVLTGELTEESELEDADQPPLGQPDKAYVDSYQGFNALGSAEFRWAGIAMGKQCFPLIKLSTKQTWAQACKTFTSSRSWQNWKTNPKVACVSNGPVYYPCK